MISFLSVVVERQLRVFSLAELSLVAVVKLQELCGVAVYRHFKAELFKGNHDLPSEEIRHIKVEDAIRGTLSTGSTGKRGLFLRGP